MADTAEELSPAVLPAFATIIQRSLRPFVAGGVGAKGYLAVLGLAMAIYLVWAHDPIPVKSLQSAIH